MLERYGSDMSWRMMESLWGGAAVLWVRGGVIVGLLK